MDGINWGGLVQRRNPFADLAEGLQVGQQMRLDQERANLFAQEQAARLEDRKRERAKEAKAEALDNENRLERGILGHMAGKDPRAASRKAMEVGQPELAKQYGELDEQQRKAATERAGVLAAYVESLIGPDPQKANPAAIKAQIMQDAPALMELGFTQQQIEAFQPTPANLARLRAEALGLKEVLQQKRADAKAEEDIRHNKVVEGQGAARVSIARGQLGVAQSNSARAWAAHRARERAGGYGTPGVPGGVIPDDAVEIDE